MSDICVRDAKPEEDAKRLLEIYAYYVKHTAITFEYEVPAVAEFHAHMGFQIVGEFHKCGYKFDRWYNMIWMEKIIGEHRVKG